MEKIEILKLLGVPDSEERLDNLELLLRREPAPATRPEHSNNHIHTTYSFSPYSPAAAIWFAREAGLPAAGIMDHDSIGGGEEFRRAGELARVGTTCGVEFRITLAGTPFEHRKINNPDQSGVAYMALHSVREAYFSRVQEVFAGLREKRNLRNRKMTAKINEIMSPFGIEINFDRDILPMSMYRDGGSVTERHLLFALADRIIQEVGESGVIQFLEDSLGLKLSARQRRWLEEADPLNFRYDLLGVLKSSLNPKIYIPADDELMTIEQATKLGEEVHGILCYAYLGDVGDSPTGDKKAEAFEDGYLDELFEFLHEKGIRGVTFMPSRNTRAQLERLMAKCREFDMLQISGEDINQPRQSFICRQLAEPEFSHLVSAAWMLVERERV
ncbi:MAG: PHP domain-containing protein [Clostridiales bacterium]|nr:PHP domain-containing protein [Clostridiales bacterium]